MDLVQAMNITNLILLSQIFKIKYIEFISLLHWNSHWITLGAIHKLRHTLRRGGGRRSVTLCDKGGGRDSKFCDITFQKEY